MPDFSTISQSPDIRAIVQENTLERAFHDSLYPRLMFRGEAEPIIFPANIGDSLVFTGIGLIKPKMRPLAPNTDPAPSDYQKEQWDIQLQTYADTIDTPMPTSIAAIANLFLRNAQQLGLGAGQTLNRLVRNKMYNAALSGHTVADGAQGPTVTLRVKRLNGFTKARQTTGNAVRFTVVSAANPLPILIFDTTPAQVARNVIGFSPDTAGDEIGPGTVTLDAVVTVLDRAYVIAVDRTFLVRVGGGFKVDDVGSGDILRLQDIRALVARFRQSNVPMMPDGRYHMHLDPTSETQVFADPEFQRLNTSLPDYVMYRELAIGELHGVIYFRNTECPQADTVEGGSTATFSQDDPFAGELYNNGVVATGVPIHRALLVGMEGVKEYYQDLSALITEAGVTGKIGEPRITNNSIEVFTERVQLILRSPQNRLQDQVAASYRFIGDWAVRTDATTGDVARFKRLGTVEHGA